MPQIVASRRRHDTHPCTSMAAIGDGALLELQRATFQYFLKEVNPLNGLVRDNTRTESPASITAVGFGLAAYAVGIECGFIAREGSRQAHTHDIAVLLEQRSERGAGRDRLQGVLLPLPRYARPGAVPGGRELSTIDTTFLLAGMLAAAAYFDRNNGRERNPGTRRGHVPPCRLAMGAERRRDGLAWLEAGEGFSEVSLGRLQRGAAALRARPRFADPPAARRELRAWSATYRWKKLYGYEFLYAGPLFIHQLSHMWIDFRGIQDEFMRARGIDYFENSRRATYVHRQYAIRNPRLPGLRRKLLGDYRKRRPGAGDARDRRQSPALL